MRRRCSGCKLVDTGAAAAFAAAAAAAARGPSGRYEDAGNGLLGQPTPEGAFGTGFGL